MAKCANAACTGTSTITTVAVPSTSFHYGSTSIAIGADGFPVISFVDEGAGALKVAKCANAACTGTSTITTMDGPPLRRVEEYASIAVGPDGLPVIAYQASDKAATTLRVARCVNPACTGTSTITVVDDPAHVNVVGRVRFDCDRGRRLPCDQLPGPDGGHAQGGQVRQRGLHRRQHDHCCRRPGFGNNFNSVGTYTSIAIGTDGFPVIAYQDDTAATLKVARCWTANCRSGEAATARLAVERAGTGGGAVSSTTPAGTIACGTTCDASFDVGTMVTLVATPSAGSLFIGWGRADCPGTGACTLTMTGDTTVTATFALAGTVAELSVTRTGDGTGRVTSTSPAGAIDCGGVCTAWLPVGTVVTLRATPSNEAIFTGWGGACSGTGACQVGLDASRAVEATFGLASAALTRYLAEGATSSFFDTRLALLNPGTTADDGDADVLPREGERGGRTVPVPASTRVTVNPKPCRDGDGGVLDDGRIRPPLVVDRTLSWDVANGYGAHAETAVPRRR